MSEMSTDPSATVGRISYHLRQRKKATHSTYGCRVQGGFSGAATWRIFDTKLRTYLLLQFFLKYLKMVGIRVDLRVEVTVVRFGEL